MPDLYGSGCRKCNKEIAAFLSEGPHMPGYLDTDGYIARYHGTPMPWPKPYVDGEYKERTVATVAGDDGWLLRVTGYPCPCGSANLGYELYRGKVELL